MKSKPTWWEKTVEYKFITSATLSKELDFAAPLSGIHEKAGDGIFLKDTKFVLIEFKRSSGELDSEKGKFKSYKNAEDELGKEDDHHFFVYGSCESPEIDLTLHACTFFSRKPVEPIFELLNRGLETVNFEKYLAKLIKRKKDDRRSTTGRVDPESFACVIGISNEGVSAISLSEYCRRSRALDRLLTTALSLDGPGTR